MKESLNKIMTHAVEHPPENAGAKSKLQAARNGLVHARQEAAAALEQQLPASAEASSPAAASCQVLGSLHVNKALGKKRKNRKSSAPGEVFIIVHV